MADVAASDCARQRRQRRHRHQVLPDRLLAQQFTAGPLPQTVVVRAITGGVQRDAIDARHFTDSGEPVYVARRPALNAATIASSVSLLPTADLPPSAASTAPGDVTPRNNCRYQNPNHIHVA